MGFAQIGRNGSEHGISRRLRSDQIEAAAGERFDRMFSMIVPRHSLDRATLDDALIASTEASG